MTGSRTEGAMQWAKGLNLGIAVAVQHLAHVAVVDKHAVRRSVKAAQPLVPELPRMQPAVKSLNGLLSKEWDPSQSPEELRRRLQILAGQDSNALRSSSESGSQQPKPPPLSAAALSPAPSE